MQFTAQQCAMLAEHIQESIRILEPVDTGFGRDHTFVDVAEDGSVHVDMPQYMHFQNDGIHPFIMWSLEGKRVPMGGPGSVRIRIASRVGARQISRRDESGRISKGNRSIRWRHPGMEPKHFVEDGIAANQKMMVAFALQNEVTNARR